VADLVQAADAKWQPYAGAGPARQAGEGEKGSHAAAALALTLCLALSRSNRRWEEEGEGDATIVIITADQIHHRRSFANRSLTSAEPPCRPPSSQPSPSHAQQQVRALRLRLSPLSP
jgi:hypothetical protein